tara:strand:- start:200 stop:412 length:213 start_codon:yes stop_codon:yes gene_type:complete
MSFKKDALIHKLQEENDKLVNNHIRKLVEEKKWFENFAGAMYKLDRDMYEKASKVAYEMLKNNKEADDEK